MAKIVIAGRSDCPYFARIEVLADQLSRNLPDFNLHKIIKEEDSWEGWLQETCQDNGWSHGKSPLVWRELVDRGGKGSLIGGANEFQEYASAYYGVKSEFNSDDMTKIAAENKEFCKDKLDEEVHFLSLSHPITVCLTNAGGPVAYSAIHDIASGRVFGPDTEIALHLLDEDLKKQEQLEGVVMETVDLALPLLRQIEAFSDARKAFKNSSVVFVLDDFARPQPPPQTAIPKDKSRELSASADRPVSSESVKAEEVEPLDVWVRRTSQKCKAYAEAIVACANSECRVILGGGGNTNFAAMVMHPLLASSDSDEYSATKGRQVVVAPTLLENQAKAILAKKVKVNTLDVVDVVVWGNAGGAFACDLDRGRVHNHDGPIWGPPTYSRLVQVLVHEEKWLRDEFEATLANRTKEEGKLVKIRNPAMAAATAVTRMMAFWWGKSPEGQIFTLGIPSNGQYDVPGGLIFNFPVKLTQMGEWEIVEDLKLSDVVQDKIKVAVQEQLELKYILNPDLRPAPPTPAPIASDPLPSGLTPLIEEQAEALKGDELSDGVDAVPHSLGKIEEEPDREDSKSHEDSKSPTEDSHQPEAPAQPASPAKDDVVQPEDGETAGTGEEPPQDAT